MNIHHENVVFVLVRPEFQGNIGSCARAIKNFGFNELRIVCPPADYKHSEARRMAVGAFDLLKQARTYKDLGSSLADVSLALATCARQYRSVEGEPPAGAIDEVIAAAQSNKVAWVFGGERNGLTSSEIERCHRVITIPTSSDCPSMNVAQAVAVIAYEMVRAQVAPRHCSPRPTGARDDAFFKLVLEIAELIGFSRSFNKASVTRELRKLYMRMSASQRELDLLTGILYSARKTIKGRIARKKNSH